MATPPDAPPHAAPHARPTLPPTDARAGAREALLATVALLALLGFGKHVVAVWSAAGSFFFTAVAAFQIYVPLWLIQRRGENPESYGIHAHGLLLGPIAALRAVVVSHSRSHSRSKERSTRRGARPGVFRRGLALYGRGAHCRGRAFLRDIARVVALAAATFPLFALGHHAWQVYVVHAGAHVSYTWNVPGDLLEKLLQNTFLIALPEEMFYRGFVEHRLDRMWPTRRMVWLVPLSRTVLLTSALFAAGHFLGEYNPARLGPFFPAFVFSGLTRRSGSITGAVAYHGLSNAFSAFLAAGYD